MKTCTKCGELKCLSDFYAHPLSALGVSSKCKECTKYDAKRNREAKKDQYAAYEKSRSNRADRVSARAAYAKTEKGKSVMQQAKKRYAEKNRALINERKKVENLNEEQLKNRRISKRSYTNSSLGAASQVRTNAKHPDRKLARIAVQNAIKNGKIIPWPVCAIPECTHGKPQAHHPDYDRPLEVVWLCPTHHKQAHAIIKG